jgi:hypothetical protein
MGLTNTHRQHNHKSIGHEGAQALPASADSASGVTRASEQMRDSTSISVGAIVSHLSQFGPKSS